MMKLILILIETTVNKEMTVPKLDENGQEQYENITDEDGNIIGVGKLITEVVIVPEIEYSWEYDEAAYNNYKEVQAATPTPPTFEERLATAEEALLSLMDLTLI